MKRHWRIAVCIGALVVVAVFAWFVWPSPYAYYEQQASSGTRLLTRINRFTQRVEFLYPGRGWVQSPVDVSKDQAERWGEWQRRYPAVKVAALWQEVRQGLIERGFTEPWSEAVQRDADSQINKVADDLQQRAYDGVHGVNIGECRFLRIVPVKLQGSNWKMNAPSGWTLDLPATFTGNIFDQVAILDGKMSVPHGLSLHLQPADLKFLRGRTPPSDITFDLPDSTTTAPDLAPDPLK